jgi:hypothetical protein
MSTDGRELQPAIAKLVIARPSVAGMGDGLFGDAAFSQTFSWAELMEGNHDI